MSQNRDTPQPEQPVNPLDIDAYTAAKGVPTAGRNADVSTNEVVTIFAGWDDIKLRRTLDKLYRKGWYGSSKPSPTGWKDQDIKAFGDFLRSTKAREIPWEDGLRALNKAPDYELGGGSGRARPSSEDLKEILQRTSLETMGKRLDDASAQRLVDSYQGVAAGASTEQAPSADVFFQNRIESQYGAESESYKYLNAISNVSKVLGSL